MSRRELDTLIRISHSVGSDAELVAGAGGNTSIKDAAGRRMWVKVSGTLLSEMQRGCGYVVVDVGRVLRILEDPALARLEQAQRDQRVKQLLLSARTPGSPDARPSVETFLHALLSRFVIHTHPAVVCGLLASRRGSRLLVQPDELLLPYVAPGYPLSLRVAREIERWRRRRGRLPSVILMQNHGLITAADDADEALALTYGVLARAKSLIGRRLPPEQKAAAEPAVGELLALRRALYERTGRRFIVSFHASARTQRLLDCRGGLLRRPLIPDQVAYCGMAPLTAAGNIGRAAGKYIETHGSPPAIVLLAGGFAAIGASAGEVANKSAIWRDVEVMYETALAFGGARGMRRADAAYIAAWEAEAYRRSLIERPAAGELAGRVALVTGAGSGLGRAISLGFLRAGASVALVDIDAGRLEDSRRQAEAFAAGRVLAARADVTDERAVAAAFRRAVLRFGGLDILVNAAGIAPSHPLVEFPAAAWRKALELNLTGYFLAAREAARLMLEQQMGGCILNVSSKTGLEASRDNSAYNASKAGELHLARGWALELGAHGIRVNSLAPGNVFKGSLIWNKQYIRACARKRGIKPSEVIPYYTGLTALKQEIRPEDVADAAVFLASERAARITGQTLVPDAGQVFVR